MLTAVIMAELDRWETRRAEAIAEYNRASIAIETLKELTDRMRAVAEEHGRAEQDQTD